MPLVDRGGDRHDLDGGDAERVQMLDRGGMREAREGAAQRFGDRPGCVLREAAHVQFVDDRVAPTACAAVARPAARRGRRRCAFGTKVRCRCRRAPRRSGVAEHRRDAARTGGRARAHRGRPAAWRVEAMAVARIVGAVGAQAVARAGAPRRRRSRGRRRRCARAARCARSRVARRRTGRARSALGVRGAHRDVDAVRARA